MDEKEVNINELHDFKGNPYSVKDDEDMQMLTESIKEFGIIEPLLVRKRDEGGFEVISGHRRKYAGVKAGLEKVPVFIRNMDRDSAVIALVDSNLHRKNILPSERAFAYKMKLEAMKHQGRKIDKTSDQLGQKLENKSSVQVLAEEVGDSKSQVQRFIRLTELIKPILDMVDDNKMAMSPAVELSYLTKEEQEDLLETMESEEKTPSLSQAQRMKELSKQGLLDMDTIFEIMIEPKANEKEIVKFEVNNIQKYFPKNYTIRQMIETIEKLLQDYQQQWKRKNRERDSR